ncbi:Protein N-acetyltransferase, RimJ/RimL family [Alkalibacterium subtropicum]|uniref:Protein N-acetyltransferase, RimJ/RimL family n=1 Tax=Alkalibacterium subtropicum TaxID=753702 RepID=A0A1I1K094_9LACT|nr:GNAT family protein [Alkalibacterium subtropicum]SFC54369.1 Protein N-acetyltransferase, RimJ/RimL family [Alkalibacterium subtropicum]
MSEAIDCIVREAIPGDAEQVLKLLNETATQTGFMTQGPEGVGISVEEEAKQLASIYNSLNNSVFVALVDDKVIGIASIHGSDKPKIEHIGDIGIVIDKAYWGYGLGTLMMEELLLWADASPVLSRLQLQVQERNTRARHIYEKLGFKLEAIIERGVKDEGQLLNVCLMSKLI